MNIEWTTVPVLAIIFMATLIRSAFGFGEALIAVPERLQTPKSRRTGRSPSKGLVSHLASQSHPHANRIQPMEVQGHHGQ